jgi:hypothetical protein
MDAAYIMAACKWVLAEIIRIESLLPVSDTQAIVDGISERSIPLIWQEAGIVRILADGYSVKEKILLLLLDRETRKGEEMRAIVEYTNVTYFKKTLRDLHEARLIEHKADDTCRLSPKGRVAAEELVASRTS